MLPKVREERTGWRCQEISARHREWGYNCPAVDLDFMVAEYNHGRPVALIEYKDFHAQMPNLDHPTYHALTDLADNYSPRPLPFMVVIYNPFDWWFRIYPVNAAAKDACKNIQPGEIITEQRFVRGLYVMRKLTLTAEDEEAIGKLNSILPEDVQ